MKGGDLLPVSEVGQPEDTTVDTGEGLEVSPVRARPVTP